MTKNYFIGRFVDDFFQFTMSKSFFVSEFSHLNDYIFVYFELTRLLKDYMRLTKLLLNSLNTDFTLILTFFPLKNYILLSQTSTD